ncbi:MAG: hypothetical protein F6K07_33465 [Okeania sp. SIO1H5]|nr:hypothetical protein [Okeania sp. SIO1H5]
MRSKNLIGARFYDPELGLWLTPDPAGQFHNPYAYGGDPVNYIDPDGEFLILTAILVGAALGGYGGFKIADSKGYSFGDWQTYAFIAGGAAIGGAAGGAGAYVGAAAATAGAGGWAAGAIGGFVGGAINGGGNAYMATGDAGSIAQGAGIGGMMGAASGGVAGGVGQGLGKLPISSANLRDGISIFGSGFAGSATGSALSGGSGTEILSAGLIGGGDGFGCQLCHSSD